MKLPNIDIRELKKLKEDNFRDRLAFLERYTKWLMENENKKWSKEQKNIIG